MKLSVFWTISQSLRQNLQRERSRAKKKQGVIEKLKAFFEKYFGLGIAEFRFEEQIQSSIYEINPTYLMVAEEPAPYGKRKN